jgi:hypothetical protein
MRAIKPIRKVAVIYVLQKKGRVDQIHGSNKIRTSNIEYSATPAFEINLLFYSSKNYRSRRAKYIFLDKLIPLFLQLGITILSYCNKRAVNYLPLFWFFRLFFGYYLISA